MNMTAAREALKQYFGYDSFRPMQAEIIQAVYEEKDTVVLMPTGGGKSVCYQIPALTLPGMTVVVSPLISLMRDQVEGLKANGVTAVFLNSSQNFEDQRVIQEKVREGGIKIIYVSPEKAITGSFLTLLKNISISLIAIDEAHCISEWGHDFRPEYHQLSTLKKSFPDVPFMALTATADRLTRRDIVSQLSLYEPEIFVDSFDRPNLRLAVLPGQNRIKTILNFVSKHPDEAGIIYCLSKKSTEKLAAHLQKEGISADYYHAGLSSEERSRRQDAFIYGRRTIMCATIAFGMGIDKSNVRFVIHYNLPKNIEGYYQEIGRAGRDGLPSETILFYSFADVINLRKFIDQSGQKEVQLAKLERIQHYADALICRRKILLNYFGENKEENCGNCDVCENPPQIFDGTVLAQKALSAIARLPRGVGMYLLIDILRGSNRQELQRFGYHEIKTYGAGKDVSSGDWQQYLLQMLHHGLIDIAYDEGNTLKLTARGKEVLLGKKNVEFILPAHLEKRREEQQHEVQKSKKEMYEDSLFSYLRLLRKTISEKEDKPAYIVFSDATLHEMAKERPMTLGEMGSISGVGEKKLAEYGEIFLSAIRSFIRDQAEEGQGVRGSTYLLTYEYYKNGLSVEAIAEKRELNVETIFSHLAYLHAAGQSVEIRRFVSPAELEQVYEAVRKLGQGARLKDFYTYLNEELEYYKIKLALAEFNVTQKAGV